MKKLIGPSIHEQTAESFLEFTKSLVIRKDSAVKEAKSVPGIVILQGKRLIIRVTRVKKEFSLEELKLLSQEYVMPEEQLLELFTKRKIRVVNENHEVINAPKPKRKSERPSKAEEANAGSEARGLKDDSLNQLEQSGPAPDVLAKELLQFGEGPDNE